MEFEGDREVELTGEDVEGSVELVTELELEEEGSEGS